MVYKDLIKYSWHKFYFILFKPSITFMGVNGNPKYTHNEKYLKKGSY